MIYVEEKNHNPSLVFEITDLQEESSDQRTLTYGFMLRIRLKNLYLQQLIFVLWPLTMERQQNHRYLFNYKKKCKNVNLCPKGLSFSTNVLYNQQRVKTVFPVVCLSLNWWKEWVTTLGKEIKRHNHKSTCRLCVD